MTFGGFSLGDFRNKLPIILVQCLGSREQRAMYEVFVRDSEGLKKQSNLGQE